MAQKKFSELETGTVDGTSIFAQTKTEDGSLVSKSASSTSLAGYIGTSHQFTDLNTNAKTLVRAINEAASSGGASVIQKTQAEYDILTTAEKMNGSIYKITDNAKMYCLDEEYHPVKELTTAQYEALSAAEKNNGTIYIQTDAETTGEDIPVNTATPNTSVNSAINACFGRTGSDIPVSTGATETIAEAISSFRQRGSATIASPRLSITSQSGSYYRIGSFAVVKITAVFGNDGQNAGLYLNDISLDGVIFLSQKTLGFMGVDNDLYELETLNNENMWVYKNGTRINANALNGKTAYITIHAAL